MTTILLVSYLLVVLVIAIHSSRRSSAYDYLISSRSMGVLAIGFSIAAGFFDSFVLVTFTGYVYQYGWPAISLFVGTAIGLVLFSLFASRLRAEAGQNKYFGMSDYLSLSYVGHLNQVA